MAAMFAVSFIFRPGNYDEEFHRLDTLIDDYAHSLEGYIGVERWVSDDGHTRNSVYYFRDQETVTTFSRYPEHREAKENYRRWYEGYQIVVSEVSASYGDGGIDHVSRRG